MNELVASNLSAVDLNKIKQKREILDLLRVRGTASSPELSKYLQISLPTCNSLISGLLASGLVVNKGVGESGGGRRPSLYGLPEDAFYVLSCDFARYSATMAIFNSLSKFVTPVVKIDTHIDDPDLVEKLFLTAQDLIEVYNIPNEKILGLGVDMPGLIDSRTGINYTIKDEKRRAIGDALQKKFNKLIYVDNDARMHAHGEFCFGAAKGYRDAIVIHWSWGIGLGIFVNGNLYSGNNGFAGEFSHIPIVDNGDLCICGKRGCLETVASSNALMKIVRQGFARNEVSALVSRFKNNPEQVSPDDVIAFARKGDGFCISALNEIGTAMGRGLSYIIQLLNPEAIVLSGPLSKARQYVLSPIQQSLNRLCIENISSNTSVIVSDIGDQSALLGTSEMIFQKVFSEFNFV